MDGKTPLVGLKGVGPSMSEQLSSLGLYVVSDLARFFPRTYADYSIVTSLADIRPGAVVARVRFENVKTAQARRGLHITTAEAVDEGGRVRVTWFNQPYRAATLRPGTLFFMRGEYGLSGNRLQIVNPSVDATEGRDDTQGGIIPTYRERGKLTSRMFCKLVLQIEHYFSSVPESLPNWMVLQFNLMSYGDALRAMHRPGSLEELEQARRRLGFEELLTVMLAVQANRQEVQSAHSIPVPFLQPIAKDFVEHLPFRLTDSQRSVVWRIYRDMDSEIPMNRLVEGDVGSGKTVVAAMAAIMAMHANQQVAFIAPTELLARQHVKTLTDVLAHSPYASQIGLLIGGMTARAKMALKHGIASHDVRLIVGTHALLQEDVDWHNLGLVIVDEQHRFGVDQRQKLHTKAGHMPHVLCLTATPIPRSLALTIYGELDISVLAQAPATRAGVETSLVSPNSRAQMFAAVKVQLEAGRQAYIVCPMITESDTIQTASAQRVYDDLRHKELRQWRVGLLHGRMKPAEKDDVMQQFMAHKIDVLVSTTVIEVGVDVPNASVMIIEGADRFGLAQLHQLRGRVGRGQHKGHCYLVMSDSKAPTRRMRAIESTTDGFQLAELDLEIRGPGAIYGKRQHGELDLHIASLGDTQLIAQAREAAQAFADQGEDLLQYTQLAASVQRAVNLTYLN